MAKSGVSIDEYMSTKLRLAKESGVTGDFQQLLAVWNGLDVNIRAMLNEPSPMTSIDGFRKALEDKERIWREKLYRNQCQQYLPRQSIQYQNAYRPQFQQQQQQQQYRQPYQSYQRIY